MFCGSCVEHRSHNIIGTFKNYYFLFGLCTKFEIVSNEHRQSKMMSYCYYIKPF